MMARLIDWAWPISLVIVFACTVGVAIVGGAAWLI